MYAVIRAGGKQYRVAPGDVIRVETFATGADGQVSFPDILAVSGTEGQVGKALAETRVVGEVVEEGRSRDAFQLVQNWEQRSPSRYGRSL